MFLKVELVLFMYRGQAFFQREEAGRKVEVWTGNVLSSIKGKEEGSAHTNGRVETPYSSNGGGNAN